MVSQENTGGELGFSYSDKHYSSSPVLLVDAPVGPLTPPPGARKVGPSRLFAEPVEDEEMEQVEGPGACEGAAPALC